MLSELSMNQLCISSRDSTPDPPQPTRDPLPPRNNYTRPKAARTRSFNKPSPLEDTMIQGMVLPAKNRPKHGEHKWMRQLSTIENPDNLLKNPNNLLNNPDNLLNDLLGTKPVLKQAIPFPHMETSHTHNNNACYPDSHYDMQSNLSQESYFLSMSPSITRNKTKSLPKLLLEAERKLPRLATPSNLLIDKRSSIPKLPQITTTSLVSPSVRNIAHTRSRSYSDPVIQPLYYVHNFR